MDRIQEAWARHFLIVVAFIVAVPLAGCQTTDYTGKGPIQLSAVVGKGYEGYTRTFSPGVFAVSQSGRCYQYYFCRGACASENINFMAVQSCEANCKGPCNILAVGRHVVWKGPIRGLTPATIQELGLKPGADGAVTVNPGPVTSTPTAKLKTPIQTAKGCPAGADRLDLPKSGPTFRECGDCPVMETIPAGTYRVGSQQSPNELPIHEVTFKKPFAIGRYEVTFDEWQACVDDGSCGGYVPMDEGLGRGNQPVINVSWDQAHAYAAWLSKKTGQTYRLPSESEWEYAARAGACTTYWWGDQPGSDHADCRDCGSQWDGKKPAPVGSFKPNAFGLYDTAGNVDEWVEDCAGGHAAAPADGGPYTRGPSCHMRIYRGGSWRDHVANMRPEFGFSAARSFLANYIGFRVAKTLP